MKKKFIFLTMMLLTLIGGGKWNVLNAQGIDLTKQYRIKALSYNTKDAYDNYDGPHSFGSDMYLHITSHSAADEALVWVLPYEETPNQIFSFESTGTENVYYLRSADGYYLHCYSWHVGAYSTDLYSASQIGVSFIDDTQFYLMNGSLYFKAELGNGSSDYKVYCDFNQQYMTATWVLEEVPFSVAVSADATEIWSDESVNLTATPLGVVGDYCSYSWSPATGLNDATSATPVFTPLAVGTYTFTCTATDANGATATSEEISILVKDAKDKPKGIIGDDSSDYSTLPGYNYYNYSISQQIYTKDEINLSAGTSINSISFKPHTIYQQNRNWSVYLINTEKKSFFSQSDYVALSEADCFYTGDVNFGNVGEWFEITFAEPFEYNGGNILICVTDNRGSYNYGTNNQYYSIYTDANCSVLNWNDYYAYDVTNPTYSQGFSSVQQKFDKLKSSIKFGYEDPTPKPQNLVIVEGEKDQLYPGETTEISWDAFDGAVRYNVYVNGVEFASATENTCKLENLPYGMNNVTVAAILEDGSESGMSSAITVQMAGTFPLTIKVKDMNDNVVANASLTIEGTDEYQNDVKFEGTTDVNGEWYKADMPLLYQSYTYSVYVSAEPFADGKEYFYESYIKNNVPYTCNVTMSLPTVNAQTEKQFYDTNEDIVLFWNTVDSEYLLGYNVYVNSEQTPRNTELLTSTIYTLEGGLVESGNIYVTAVYDVYGESAKGYGTYVNIYVYGTISGIVTDGTNPIAGAEVVAKGTDNITWMENEYSVITDNNGKYELSVLPNYQQYDNYYAYSVSVSKYGYENYVSSTKYDVVGGETTTIEAIVLTPNADVTFAVTATEGEGNVTVSWDAPEGATQYNVFRKDATEKVVKLTETPITEQEYLATDWAELTNGTYQYGVSAFVGGGEGTVLNETFENGMPEGWTTEKDSDNITSWEVKATDYTLISHIDGSYVFTKGTVTNGYSILKTTEYMIPNDAKLIFEYYSKQWGGDIDYLEIYAVNENNEEFLLTTADNYDAWTMEEVSLSQYAGQRIKLYFKCIIKYGYGLAVDNIKITGDNTYESSINWSNDVAKTSANVFTGIGNWNDAANWSNGVPANGANVFINGAVTIASEVNVNNMTINGSVTVDNGAALTVNGTLVNEAAENLVINDGGQIFQNNNNIPATFVKNIRNYSENENAWQFVASPLTDASIFSHANGNYDLFKYFGQAELEWYNHKLHAADFGTVFVPGVGYLVSHETADNIVMTGTLNNANYNTWSGLSFDIDGVKDVANFNLLGNPFTFNMKWSEVTTAGLVAGYAYLNEDGGYETAVDGEIAVGDAFFVKAKSADAQMSYGEELRGAKAEQSEYINLIASGKAGRDNVIINLAGKQEGFTKMQNFNESIATVYVTEDNTRYGIYNCDTDVEEVVVSFNAKEMGDYTIAAITEGGFSSVTLVDLFTGIETDLLTSGYTFAAKSGDNAERFVVRFSYSQDSAMDSNFVYQSGEDLIIMAEGALQIVDMLGRVVYYSEVATDVTRVNVSNFDNAAYIVRVVNGEGVKTQKVVIY